MATRGKSINLFLMDGEASGRIKCTLANWTGIAYNIPRTALDQCKERDDLKQSGVYFLFGVSDTTGKNVVYIGQAGARKNGEGILNRLQEHKRNPEKDYWTEAIVFTTSNNSFGPTEISYLENRFCNLAIKANRYEVKNGNDPTLGNITEEKESEMEEFIDYARVIMGTLGHKVFEPITNSTYIKQERIEETPCKTDRLYLKRNIRNIGVIEAIGSQTSEGFVVFAGSCISPKVFNSIPEKIKKQRINAKISDGILQEDMLFTSPSYAGAFIIGQSCNGLLYWKTEDGRTLKSLEAEEK